MNRAHLCFHLVRSLSVAIVAACVLALGTAPASAAPEGKAKSAKSKSGKKKPKPVESDSNGGESKAPKPPPEAAPGDAPAAPGAPPGEEGRGLQRGERVEFDARLIQGQTAKAGAVYLFERVGTNLRSMVKERTSFRDKIVRRVFPKEETDR